MTTQQDERAELIAWLTAKQEASDGFCLYGEAMKYRKAAALLEADAKGGEAVAEWHLDSEAAQFLAELITADEDGPTEISLRVGQIKDDDGTVKHGLLVYETEYPEEGASLLVECPPLYTRPQPQAVAQGWKLYGNRQDFERYASEQGYRDFEQNEFDGYKNSHTQARWNFWRAGQDAMLSAAPKPQEPV